MYFVFCSKQLGSMFDLCEMKVVTAEEDSDQAEVTDDDSVENYCALPIEQHALTVY